MTKCRFVLLFLLLASCASRASRYPDLKAPLADIETVAVCNFVNSTAYEIDTMSWANIFASELVKFNYKVARPVRVAETVISNNLTIRDINDLVNLGKLLRADAIIIAEITDYDQYPPPKLAISLQMFRVKERQISATEIDKIIQSATYKPMNITRENAKSVSVAFERVFDTHSEKTRRTIKEYAETHYGSDFAYKEGEQFMYDSERFFQFVSYQIIDEMVKMTNK